MLRGTLRRRLQAEGVPVNGDPTDGATATIVEFVDYWGVLPGATPACDDAAIDKAVAVVIGRLPENANGYRLVPR